MKFVQPAVVGRSTRTSTGGGHRLLHFPTKRGNTPTAMCSGRKAHTVRILPLRSRSTSSCQRPCMVFSPATALPRGDIPSVYAPDTPEKNVDGSHVETARRDRTVLRNLDDTCINQRRNGIHLPLSQEDILFLTPSSPSSSYVCCSTAIHRQPFNLPELSVTFFQLSLQVISLPHQSRTLSPSTCIFPNQNHHPMISWIDEWSCRTVSTDPGPGCAKPPFEGGQTPRGNQQDSSDSWYAIRHVQVSQSQRTRSRRVEGGLSRGPPLEFDWGLTLMLSCICRTFVLHQKRPQEPPLMRISKASFGSRQG